MNTIQEVEFSMDDISDDVYFELSEDISETSIFDEEILDEIFEVVVKSKWFVQGNKTEGIFTIGEKTDNGVQNGWEVNISWKSITMGDDWDTDVEVDHEMDFFLYHEQWRWVLTPR